METKRRKAAALASRKDAYEALHPETRNGATGGGHNQLRQLGEAADRFTADTAAKTGQSERAVQRDAERGELLKQIEPGQGARDVKREADSHPPLGGDATDNLATAFSSETSKATGKDERTIRRAAARGEALGDDLAEIAGTSLDSREKNSVAHEDLLAGSFRPLSGCVT